MRMVHHVNPRLPSNLNLHSYCVWIHDASISSKFCASHVVRLITHNTIQLRLKFKTKPHGMCLEESKLGPERRKSTVALGHRWCHDSGVPLFLPVNKKPVEKRAFAVSVLNCERTELRGTGRNIPKCHLLVV